MPARFKDSRYSAAVEWILLALLVGVFAVRSFAPAWRQLSTNFTNYYLAAAVHRQGIPLDRAYEWRWFQRYNDYFRVPQSVAGFAPQPPIGALPVLPIAKLPPLRAKRVWLVINLAFLGLLLWILRQVTALSWRRLLLLSFLCLLPLHDNFWYGQYYLLLLLLITAAYFAACRGWQFTAGGALACAAALKLFPAFFLFLFFRKRNWRALAGLVVTGAALAALSVLLFGWNVHKIFLLEVLPRAAHGDQIGPYALEYNSFTALFHRLFLFEPELNPAPWLNSPIVYSLAQAALATVLLFSFLLFTGEEENPQTTAWEWATFLPLLILLSSMPTAYHHCLLIFTVIVGVDLLLKRGRAGSAFLLVVFFAIASFPWPAFLWINLQLRLIADLLLYTLLLYEAPGRMNPRFRTLGYGLATVWFGLLAFSNIQVLRNRDEDFSRRLSPSPFGYGAFSIEKDGSYLLVNEMMPRGFTLAGLQSDFDQQLPLRGDVLAVAAAPHSPFVYVEVASIDSRIFRLPSAQIGQTAVVPEEVAQGHDPAISPDGRWLAFLTDKANKTEIHLLKDGQGFPISYSERMSDILEMSLSSDGTLIFASGGAANPHLSRFDSSSGTVRRLIEISGAVRHPASSSDGKNLAFSRRESGAWHLFVRDLQSGAERQLTSAACNATSPSWEDSHTLLYVSDCGRGLGLGAPVRVDLDK
ncbi:MAG TPA: glycosyltransferase 87 family protein [Candidatus Sulfotelmatobacter sp.]|nr:glycosyltransferase 87 family protein [Candidatus Sulfotelmatobacter sp.]